MTEKVPEKHAQTKESGASYRSILKSTSLIGGASVLNIMISMVRTKFVAILLGPTGIGLLSLYNQILSVTGTVTGLGIANSGVRQMAEAVGTGDEARIACTVITLRRTAWLTGAFGIFFMAVFSRPISQLTFNSTDHTWPIILLGITLLFTAIATGQSCILRGTRRISDIAMISVFGALLGTVVSIPCFFVWGIQGIIPSILLSSLLGLATSWWYARKVSIASVSMSWRESSREARSLLTLGISFMGAGLITAASTYLVQVYIIRQFGIANFGIYQAAYILSGVLAGFVLNAMGTDYYPRLTAAAGDDTQVIRMVNEQSQISILLALPGLMAMMIFAPLVIKLFYSVHFSSAVPILRWCILGILGRVFSWPLGFVMLALGKGRIFFITEFIGCVLHLAAVYFFTGVLGINGAGVAFMAAYVAYTGLMLIVMRRLVGATWSRHTLKLTVFASISMLVLMLNCSSNGYYVSAWIISVSVLGSVTWFCLKQLSQQSDVSFQSIMKKMRLKK